MTGPAMSVCGVTKRYGALAAVERRHPGGAARARCTRCWA